MNTQNHTLTTRRCDSIRLFLVNKTYIVRAAIEFFILHLPTCKKLKLKEKERERERERERGRVG